MKVTTPPPGDWHEGSPVTVVGYGPQGSDQWTTHTTDGREWSDPERWSGQPVQLPAEGEDGVPEQPIAGGEATTLPETGGGSGGKWRPGGKPSQRPS